MDYQLQLVLLPVADVDAAKAFYTERMGFNLDVDHQPSDEFRVIQVTPPGSACSVSFGIGITKAVPGSVEGLHLVVTDIVAAHAELTGRGVDVSEITHYEGGQQKPGPDPKRGRYGSYANFKDPDGNTWVLQEVPADETVQ